MIHGIGIDIVSVARMRHWLDNPGLLRRFFHPGELQLLLDRHAESAMSCAARFAAKEALGKALGVGLRGFVLREIEVVNDTLGRPELQLHASAKQAFARFHCGRIHLSLTHNDDNAVAMVVIESRSDDTPRSESPTLLDGNKHG